MAEEFKPGLEGVVAAQTRLSSVDGRVGELIIAGFPVEELAGKATYEEAVYLLWYDELPNRTQLAEFRQALAARRELPAVTLDLLRAAAAQKASVMDALRMATGTLSLRAPGEAGQRDEFEEQVGLIGRCATIVTAYWRLLNGQEPIAPRQDLGQAADYLRMLFASEPSEGQVRGLETYWNTISDHGLNASTFAARVIIATDSDVVSAIVGAIGALKGPKHGGAPGPALDMVFEIGQPERAEAVMRAKLDRGERLMGFGHRVYKVRDPRAIVLAKAAERMFAADGDTALYELAKHVEKTAIALLEEYKPGRNLQTNVEFYTALLLHGLGMATDLFTPTFAAGRVAGWIAHCREQQAANRIIRPESVYVGVKNREWVGLEERDV
jgi:citrate synthase